jgi:ribonuclease HI
VLPDLHRPLPNLEQAHQTSRTARNEVTSTRGACINNGKESAQCGAGIWFGPDHELNKAIRIPGREQSNQVGELGAIIAAIEAVPINQPLKIISDSRYAIEGLTENLPRWEDKG